MFHFNEGQDQQEEAGDDNSAQKRSPSLFPSLPTPRDSVPFPSSSLLLSPPSPANPTITMRRTSSQIILSNGKPLKSSLKHSSSSPHIPQIAHIRTQPAPAAPNLLKNVRFPESDDALESVRVFNRHGKPANISRPAGQETDTETEAEPSAHPFPHSHSTKEDQTKRPKIAFDSINYDLPFPRRPATSLRKVNLNPGTTSTTGRQGPVDGDLRTVEGDDLD